MDQEKVKQLMNEKNKALLVRLAVQQEQIYRDIEVLKTNYQTLREKVDDLATLSTKNTATVTFLMALFWLLLWLLLR